MKKLFMFLAATTLLVGCGTTVPAKLVSSATHNTVAVATPVVAIFADLEVSPKKISFFYLPSNTVVAGGYDNVVNSAVREALASNGDADVLVGMETQVKYNAEGQPESITVTGYPAKYVNFRNAGDEYLKNAGAGIAAKEKSAGSSSPLGKLKIGK